MFNVGNDLMLRKLVIEVGMEELDEDTVNKAQAISGQLELLTVYTIEGDYYQGINIPVKTNKEDYVEVNYVPHIDLYIAWQNEDESQNHNVEAMLVFWKGEWQDAESVKGE